jgi:hypothetical protein
MVDPGIKKTTIKYSDLPALSVASEGYTIRYRVISEDRNRKSHWSPVVSVIPEYTFNEGEIDFFKQGNIITSTWDAVEIKKGTVIIEENANEYDVWIRYDRSDAGDYVHKQRVIGTSISTVHPATYTKGGVVQALAPNKYSIEVYLKGIPVSQSTAFLRVYQDGPHTI